MRADSVLNTSKKFMTTEYWNSIVDKYTPIFVYIGGSYSIMNNQNDIDLCVVSDFDMKNPPIKTACFQFFFKDELIDNEYLHLDTLITPSNYFISVDNIFMASIQKVFFNINNRIIYFNPKYKLTRNLLNDEDFIERCCKLALIGIFDQLSLDVIDYTENKKITLGKHSYELYYCYCMMSGEVFDESIGQRLRNISQEQEVDDELVLLFKKITKYCLNNPVDTINEAIYLNKKFYDTVCEDRKNG